MLRIRTLVAALAAAFAVTGGVAANASAEPARFGIAEPGSFQEHPARASFDEVAGLVQEVGATSHRYPINWNTVEPSAPVGGQHRYDFSTYDRMYEADMAKGVQPLLIVALAPPWSWAPGVRYTSGHFNPPGAAHYADWRAFVSEVARRYPGAVGIEVWNEPNLPRFWGNGDPLLPTDAGQYTQLLCEAHAAIKSTAPNMPVVGGALSNQQRSVGGMIAAATYARAMFQSGAARCMDGVSTHPYPGRANDMSQFTAGLDQLRAARDSVGASTPLWLTEVGITTTGPSGVSEQQQADVMVDLARRIRAMSDVRAFYVHTMTEPTQDSGNSENGFALVRGQGIGSSFPRKPAFYALQREARRSGEAGSGAKRGSNAQRGSNADPRASLRKATRTALHRLRRRGVKGLLADGRFTYEFRSPAAGRLSVTLRTGARGGRSGAVITAASARKSTGTPRRVRVKVRLTSSGRRALRRARKRVSVKLRASFAATGRARVSHSAAAKLAAPAKRH